MLAQAQDYRAECEALDALLRDLPDQRWEEPTQFKRWTCNDVIGHLHLFDVAARITLESTEQVRAFFADAQRGRAEGRTLVEYTREWLGGCNGQALRRRWAEFAQELADLYAAQDPARRVAWGGPDMSVRSCISARQMEAWAHGQAMFDLLGVERAETDRLRNIAIMGVNTLGWCFVNRKLAVPDRKPLVRLSAPSGAVWEWNADEDSNRVQGSAVDFCRVVTQTRNIADTGLQVHGDIARHWMAIAQCFAGPPEQPPAPGSRHRTEA
jgi:uncharacterized protein (TIGR03084 family)